MSFIVTLYDIDNNIKYFFLAHRDPAGVDYLHFNNGTLLYVYFSLVIVYGEEKTLDKNERK